MALYFDGSSAVEFANPINLHDGPLAIAVLYKPNAILGTSQYLIGMADEDPYVAVGGMSAFILPSSFGSELRVIIGRDTVKYQTTTSDPVKSGIWNMFLANYNGILTDSTYPIIMNLPFPQNSSSYTYASDTLFQGSGAYKTTRGKWTIGRSPADISYYEGDIEYVAVFEWNGTLLAQLFSGISPLSFRHQKYLKFFVRLNDPNNVIDVISGQKGGIVGALQPSSSQPRVSY